MKPKNRAAGFTLIELLVVICIITILITILIVAVNMRSKGVVEAGQMIQQLETQLQVYFDTFGAYPPSSHSGMNGAQCLYFFLMGPTNEKDGRPEGWDPAFNDKISPEYAWKPPAGFDKYKIGRLTKNGPPFFTDGDPSDVKAILYYRANRAVKANGMEDFSNYTYKGIYNKDDNKGGSKAQDYFWSPTEDEWKAVVVDKSKIGTSGVAGNEAGQQNRPYNASSYLLMAAGSDRKFGYNPETKRRDDITNFGNK